MCAPLLRVRYAAKERRDLGIGIKEKILVQCDGDGLQDETEVFDRYNIAWGHPPL